MQSRFLDAIKLLLVGDFLDAIIVLIDLRSDLYANVLDTIFGYAFRLLAAHAFTFLCLSDFKRGAPLELEEEVGQQLVDRPGLLIDVHERADLVARLGDGLEVVDAGEAEYRVDVREEVAVALGNPVGAQEASGTLLFLRGVRFFLGQINFDGGRFTHDLLGARRRLLRQHFRLLLLFLSRFKHVLIRGDDPRSEVLGHYRQFFFAFALAVLFQLELLFGVPQNLLVVL